MRGHIVRPFQGMFIVRRVLRHHHIQVPLKITAHIRVGVFINGQRGGGMLNKQMQQTNLQIRQLREASQHLIGHKMATPGHGRQS